MSEIKHPSAGLRRREVEWRRAHRKDLELFAGQWVVLEGETIVAHGDDAGCVVAEARLKGVTVPYVFRVELRKGKAWLSL